MNASTQRPWHAAGAASLLTLFAVAVHGFHPYAEDGGLYVAGIKRLLSPATYGADPQFVTAPMHFSLFAPSVAALVRASHLPLAWMLLALYCFGIWITLYAAGMLASRCLTTPAARVGAMTLLACWLTLPVAGTSLMLMDPYVTSRTFCAPLVLMALAWTMDAASGSLLGGLLAALALTIAALLHPLMAGYGLAATLLLAAASSRALSLRCWAPRLLATVALLIALAVQACARPESADYVRIAMTRYYWFPFQWQWYEQAGLLAPLALLLYLHPRGNLRSQALSRMALELGVIALLVAALFAQARLATHPVARLQPLRSFAIIYQIMILLLGGFLGERWLRARSWRWATMLTLCGGTMFFVQRSTYPSSSHLELPWRTPSNPWEQAFLWVRDHTPADAVFALDAHYITRGPGEDAQCFRAIAERDALPDYSKDGGEAAIAPWLTAAWVRGQAAQTGLEEEADAIRAARLKPLRVSWIILKARTPTAWTCHYTNHAVKVCRLP